MSLKHRIMMALIFVSISAVMMSIALKPFALVWYAIALIALFPALALALSQSAAQQLKVKIFLVSIVILLCGIGTYVLLSLLHR